MSYRDKEHANQLRKFVLREGGTGQAVLGGGGPWSNVDAFFRPSTLKTVIFFKKKLKGRLCVYRGIV